MSGLKSKSYKLIAVFCMPLMLLPGWDLQTTGLGDYTGSAVALDAYDSLHAIFVDQPLKIFKTNNGGMG